MFTLTWKRAEERGSARVMIGGCHVGSTRAGGHGCARTAPGTCPAGRAGACKRQPARPGMAAHQGGGCGDVVGGAGGGCCCGGRNLYDAHVPQYGACLGGREQRRGAGRVMVVSRERRGVCSRPTGRLRGTGAGAADAAAGSGGADTRQQRRGWQAAHLPWCRGERVGCAPPATPAP